jgi:hypothetical protein
MRARKLGVERAVDMHLALVGEGAAFSSRMRSAARIRRPLSLSRLPNWLPEHSAMLGSTPKRFTWRAVAMTVSAICSGVGWAWTWVSAMKSGPSSRIIRLSAPTGMKRPRPEDLA